MSNFVRTLRIFYEYLVFYGSLAYFGLISLVWSLLAGVLHLFLPVKHGEPIGQFVMMMGFRSFVKVMEVSGIIRCDLRALDALRDTPSLVIAPNHPSLLDAVLVISRLPRVICITKPEIWNNPFLGGSVRLAGFIRNDAAVSLVKHAAAQVRARHHLLIFPEGTRTVSPPVNRFKGGFALIAKNAGAPVQTVFITSNSRFLGKGWPLFRKPPFPLHFRVELGRRLEVSDNVQDFLAELESYYAAELAHRCSPGRVVP
jgi:1-acyl-sn-glycerol-3-phosphate acyltransferase